MARSSVIYASESGEHSPYPTLRAMQLRHLALQTHASILSGYYLMLYARLTRQGI